MISLLTFLIIFFIFNNLNKLLFYFLLFIITAVFIIQEFSCVSVIWSFYWIFVFYSKILKICSFNHSFVSLIKKWFIFWFHFTPLELLTLYRSYKFLLLHILVLLLFFYIIQCSFKICINLICLFFVAQFKLI